jgi:hypothetical protein
MRKFFKSISLLLGILIALSLLSGFFVMSTPVSASTGYYSANKITLTSGKIASGSVASLGLKDNSNLVVNSVYSSGYYCTDWIAEFILPVNQVSSLSLSYSGKYSTWRGQTLFLYNFATSTWQRMDYRTISSATTSFSLPSITAPAVYVSSNGQVRVRTYSYSTAVFTSYTDYLKLSANIADAPQTPAPAPTPAPTPTPTPMPVNGDYCPNQTVVTGGQAVSGSYSSLSKQDGAFLTIKSTVSSSYYATDWYAVFTLPSNQVSSLSLSYAGKYSTWRGQSLFLYNFATSAWQRIDYRSLSAATTSFSLPSITAPANYVSANGQVRVRSYSYGTASFSAYADYLKLSVK